MTILASLAPFIAFAMAAIIGFMIGRHTAIVEQDSLPNEIEKLDIQPGDTFVLRYDRVLNVHQRAQLRSQLFRLFGSDRSITPIVLEDGMRIEVVTKAERTEQA